MNFFLSLSAGIALSMDCLAVASCYGVQVPKNRRLMLQLGFWFGLFQFGMILLGSLMGSLIVSFIYRYAKILSAVLLVGIAIKMFIEGVKGEESCYEPGRMMIVYLAFATSVDALLVGLAYSILRENIFVTSIVVGITCFLITVGGFMIGSLFHKFVGRFAQFLGSLILFLVALKTMFVE